MVYFVLPSVSFEESSKEAKEVWNKSMNQWVNESINQQMNELMHDFLGEKSQYQTIKTKHKTRLN